MRILQVSTYDLAGGAEKVAWNLFQEYRQRGHSSWLAVGYKRSDAPDILSIPNDRFRSRWAHLLRPGDRLLRTFQGRIRGIGFLCRLLGYIAEPRRQVERWQGIEDFNFPRSYCLLELPPQLPDIVHCHNLHGGYFDLRALPMLSHRVPIILTLHDAWLLTGHCAHSFDCERWRTGCGHCSNLSIYPAIQHDATAYNWQRKKDIYARSRLYITSPSQWLMDKVQQSMLHSIKCRVIPNGVDLSIFHPSNQYQARKILGLPPDAWVLLFVGNATRSSPWRDYNMLESAVASVAAQRQGQQVILVCLGDEGDTKRLGRAEVRFIGYQRQAEVVACFYQAADLYLHPARAETFGLTVAEALACGTPVVATAVGGIPEQIKNGVNGFLVPAGDSEAMAACTEQLLSDNDLRLRLGAQAVELARSHFDLKQQANEYLDWYGEILEKWQAPS